MRARTRNKVGTGLGLPFCELAVEAQGRTIHLKSRLAEGRTSSFVIPLGL